MCTKKLGLQALLVTGENLLFLTLLKINLSFLKQPDISYCNPGQKDTVYMGKVASGKRVYTQKI